MRGKFSRGRRDADSRDGGRGRRLIIVTVASVGAEAACLWLRAGRIGGRVVVRCRDGHLLSGFRELR